MEQDRTALGRVAPAADAAGLQSDPQGHEPFGSAGRQAAALRALVAACALRQLLEEWPVSPLKLRRAQAKLIAQCHGLLRDRDYLLPLALMREAIERFVEETRSKSSLQTGVDAPRAAALLKYARHRLLTVIARLWALQEVARRQEHG